MADDILKKGFIGIGRWVGISLLFIVFIAGIAYIGTSPLRGIATTFLSAVGIFLSLPKFNTWTKGSIPKIHPAVKTVIVFFIFVATANLIPSGGPTTPTAQAVQDIETLTDQSTPEETVQAFIELGNYSNFEEKTQSYGTRTLLASGYAKKRLQVEKKKYKELHRVMERFQEDCRAYSNIVKKRDCNQNFLASKREMGVRDISTQRINETVSYVSTTLLIKNSTSETSQELTYVLEKIGDKWFIADILENGTLYSETEPVAEIQEEGVEALVEIESLADKFHVIAEAARALNDTSTRVARGVTQSDIETDRIQSVNVGYLHNRTNSYGAQINLFFHDGFMTDDYLIVERDSTELFRYIFARAPKVDYVKIYVKTAVKDAYGNTEEKLLAQTAMNRETFQKINWNGFDYTRLDEITPVAFYGDSLYKDLKELESSLEEMNAMSSSYQLEQMGAPQSTCGDALTQCQKHGECETYHFLQATSVC